MADFYNYLSANYEQILNLLWQHIYLSVISVLIAVIIGIPLGILISREQKLVKANNRNNKCHSSCTKLGFTWVPYSIHWNWQCPCHRHGRSVFPSSHRKEYVYRINEHRF